MRTSIHAGLVLLGFAFPAAAVDRIVGVQATSGGASLVKKVHVRTGAEVSRIELVSNDLATVFPAVRLRRIEGRIAGDVLTEARSVAANGNRHRWVVELGPVVFLQDEEILIEVVLPAAAGADGPRSGVGLGANNLGDAPATSFIGSTLTGDLQPIDADLCISLPESVGKAAGRVEPLLEPSAPLSLRVHRLVDGAIEVRVAAHAQTPALIEIFDVKGALVHTLLHEALAEGEQTLIWDRRDARGGRTAAGVYFVTARIGETTAVRKTVVLR
jgi:hypothetical protein